MTDAEFLDMVKQANMLVSIIYDQVYERPELKYLTPLDFQGMLKKNMDSFSFEGKPHIEKWMISKDALYSQSYMEDLYLHYLLSEYLNNIATENSHELPKLN